MAAQMLRRQCISIPQISLEVIFSKAVEANFSKQGEMFSGKYFVVSMIFFERRTKLLLLLKIFFLMCSNTVSPFLSYMIIYRSSLLHSNCTIIAMRCTLIFVVTEFLSHCFPKKRDLFSFKIKKLFNCFECIARNQAKNLITFGQSKLKIKINECTYKK